MALFALLLAATISFGIFLKKSAEDTRYKKHVLISRVISIITAAAIKTKSIPKTKNLNALIFFFVFGLKLTVLF